MTVPRAEVELFERWRRTVGLSLELAARLWAEGIRSPESLLGQAGDPEGLAALCRRTGCDQRQLAVLVEAALRFKGET